MCANLPIFIFLVSRRLALMSKSNSWVYTLNNYTDDDVSRLSALGLGVTYVCFGKEVGDNGNPHLQGFVQFHSRKLMDAVKRYVGARAHVEVARDIPNAVEYCKKEGDFHEVGEWEDKAPPRRSDLDDFKKAVKDGVHDLAKIREDHSEVYAKYPRFCLEYIRDQFKTKELASHPWRPWQEELNGILNREPDDRTVHFVVDRVGNMGKTWFAHYYTQVHQNCQVIQPGKKCDMAYALKPNIRVLFMDAPRSRQGEIIQYDFLEDVKNGHVFSTKYESFVKSLPKCHVVVMMNEHPDMSKLSVDRYKIIVL
jgi:Putative viral replication protein